MTPSVRLTRRGYAVLAVAVGAFAAGTQYGPRTLDAIVLPAAVVLLAGVVQVWQTTPPTLERRLPPPDEPGTTGVVEVEVSASRPYPVTVRDRLPPGIESVDSAANTSAEASVGSAASVASADPSESTALVDATTGGDAVSYEIHRQRRGRHEIGPASVVVTDVLGLVTRTYEIDTRDTVVVYPPVQSLSESVRRELQATIRTRQTRGRSEFDTLREYVSGDALRDVHWKSSAKRNELVVREFANDPEFERLTVAAETASESAATTPTTGSAATASSDTATTPTTESAATTTTDAMATAAATVCLALVGDGVAVILETPSGSVDAAPGQTRPLLEHLASVEGGTAATEAADVRIVASAESVSIRFDGRVRDFNGPVAAGGSSAGSEEGRI